MKNIKIIIFTLLGITPSYEIGSFSIVVGKLYFVFYLTFRFIKYHKINFIIIFIFLCSTLYYGNIIRNKHYYFENIKYIKSHFSFLFGLIIAQYENKIINKIQKYYTFYLLLFLYFRFYFINYELDFINYLHKNNLSSQEPKFYLKFIIIYNLNCLISIIVILFI